MRASGAAVVRGVHCEPLGYSIADYVAATDLPLQRNLSAADWDYYMLEIIIDVDTIYLLNRLDGCNRLLRGFFATSGSIFWGSNAPIVNKRSVEAVNIRILRCEYWWLTLCDPPTGSSMEKAPSSSNYSVSVHRRFEGRSRYL